LQKSLAHGTDPWIATASPSRPVESKLAAAEEEGEMGKIKFKVKLDGAESGEGAALSAPFDVEETFGTKAGV